MEDQALKENKQKLRYGLYLRRSSDESSGKQIQSVENQLQVLEEKAAKEELKIVDIYKESKSAKKPGKRADFNRMIADLRSGVIDAVICWDLSRLSRNPTEGGTVQQLLFDGILKEIATYERKYFPGDCSLIMNFELGMATEYSQALGKNVKRGQRFKVDKKIAPGKAPLGYLNTTDRKKGEKEIIPDPERFDLVRQLWDWLLSGKYSVWEILQKAKTIGLKVPGTKNRPAKPLTKTGLYKLFRNKFFYGKFKWSNTWHNGIHTQMITKREFERAQEIITSREKPKKYKYDFVFGSTLLKCATCKASITGRYKNKVRRDGSINYRIYYKCTHRKTNIKCTEIGIREEELEKQFIELLDSIKVSDGFVKWAARWLHGEKEIEASKRESIKEQQRKQIDKLDKQLDRLIDLRLEETIDDETFKFKKELFMSEKRTIEKDMEINTDFQDYRIDKTVEVFEFCRDAKNAFESGTREEKKTVLKALVSHFYLKDRKLIIELSKPFKLIQDGHKTGLTLDPRFPTLETQSRIDFDDEKCRLIKLGGGEEELPLLSKSERSRISTSLA